MNNKVIITADSTCDLTNEQKEMYGIETVPLYVRLGDEEHRDGVDVTPDELFAYVSAKGILPKTAACTAADYADAWKKYLDAGYDIVHIDISSEMSACCQNANNAADEYEGRVRVVDSRNLSTGTGLLAIEGAVMAKEGYGLNEIADRLEEKKRKLNVSFVIETMEYLAKGGRCSSVVALAAGMLRIKPCIEVKEGKMGVCKKYRGKMNQVLSVYVHERLKEAGEVDAKRIFITHSGVTPEVVSAVRAEILAEKPFAEVLESRAGCTISSHCGPGTLGILFFEA